MQLEMEADTSGIDAVKARMKKLDALVRIFALQVLAIAIASINSGHKSGRTYRRGAFARTLVTGGKRAKQLAAMGLKGRVAEEAYTSEFSGKSFKGKTRFVTGFKFHRASAEGEAPATDEGNLVNSGFTRKGGAYEWFAGFSAAYAERLETIMNRPFLKPALESVREGFLAAVKAVFDER